MYRSPVCTKMFAMKYSSGERWVGVGRAANVSRNVGQSPVWAAVSISTV